jgi:signal transduction histidine kinase/DNA-binding NarL/FixJ family response regulator/HPt (histidine-containing phosphotransfer) domain-containing protein/HAMP domain-containing protein
MQWLSNMKIKTRLFLAFGILVLLMFFTNLLGVWLFTNANLSYNKLITESIQRHLHLAKSIENITRIRFDIFSEMYIKTNGEHSQVISALYKDQGKLNAEFEESISNYYDKVRLDTNLSEEERQERTEALEEIKDLFFNTYIPLTLNAERNDNEPNEILLQSLLVVDSIAGKLGLLYNNAFNFVEKRNLEVMEESLNAIKKISIVVAGILVFSIFLSVILARSVNTPIIKMRTGMAEIAKGNLAYPIRSGIRDELGNLSNDIANMVDQISEMNKTVAIMDFLDSMIHIVSLNFNIIYMNDKLAETYGVDKEKCIGQKCYKVLHGLDRPCPHCLWPRTLSTKEQNKLFTRERTWDAKLGKWFGGKAAIIRWIDGSPVQFYYLVDETMHHNYEAKLQEAAEEAKAASLSKTAFLANMSHEIRTPMNAILGITEIQMENESLPTETREALGKIYNSGDLLLGIINDILDMSKIEAGKLELLSGKYEVASLINDTVHLNMMRFENKPVDFKLQVDETIPTELIGDELRIKQILNNLLSNAAKYTASGVVVFSVSAEQKDGVPDVMLVFKVRDTGQGMTKDQVSKLFDAYSRFNMEVNRTIEGTGLGMNITSKLLHMMNGEIEVDSEPGRGSEFTVKVPQGSTGAKPLGKELVESMQQFRLNSTSQKKTQLLREPMPYGSVLVVDDMEANLYVAKGILSPYGLKIETAISGFEAIEKIQTGINYDIIFMDHMMPKMDGIETTTILRKSMGYTRPIIALTADAVAGRADVFLANGFDAFISKPINTRRLNEVLNTYIRDKQTPEVIEAARQEHKALQKDAADTSGEGAAGTGTANSDDALLEELSRIDGLNVSAGLAYIGDNKESYFGILRFFSEKCDSYLDELDKTMKGEIWGDYAIKVHALKGVMANLGAGNLSQWAAKLEKASKAADDPSLALCREETTPFCADLREFRDSLRRTSLFKSPADTEEGKKSGDMQFLKEQIGLLKEACVSYSFGETKKIITALGEYEWDAETGKELENIRQFIVSLDYDKALEGMNRLL